MLHLKLVKSEELEEDAQLEDGDDTLPHGGKILKQLVMPWSGSQRIVCADSYFASVASTLALQQIGLRFIGVVKTAHKRFPQAWLSRVQFGGGRGHQKGLIHTTAEGYDLLSFVWVDRERRYFIASAGSLQPGEPYDRVRWRQVNQADPHADAERVRFDVPQPKACELYYTACGMIDQHNRHRQDTLQLERKFRTHDWSKRVNMSIFAMIVVDTWLVYDRCVQAQQAGQRETQKEFYSNLAEELIDNTFDTRRSVARRRNTSGKENIPNGAYCPRTCVPTSGVGPRLTPTKRKRARKDGTLTNQNYQGHCAAKGCNGKAKFVCSVCRDKTGGKEIFFCHSDTGRDCFAKHLTKCHASYGYDI